VNPASAFTVGASGSSSSIETAIAASAFSTLCTPGRFSVIARSGMRVPLRRCAVKRIWPPGSASTSTARTCTSSPRP
jgi:hypothetical protein